MSSVKKSYKHEDHFNLSTLDSFHNYSGLVNYQINYKEEKESNNIQKQTTAENNEKINLGRPMK
jgi:phage portal protein BeeE